MKGDAVAGGTVDAGVLIEAARGHIVDVLAPLLPPERKYDLAMVQNALAIAARLVGDAGAVETTDAAAFRAFYAARGVDAGADVAAALVRDLRSGALDDALTSSLPAALRPGVIARLAQSNPKAALPQEIAA